MSKTVKSTHESPKAGRRMICLSFMSPSSISEALDRNRFDVAIATSDNDLQTQLNVPTRKDRQSVLLVTGIRRLLRFKDSEALKAYRILAFDVPSSFKRRGLTPIDATCELGSWSYKKISEDLLKIIVAERPGL